MQIVSLGDNLHEKSMPIFWKKGTINLSSTEIAQRVIKVIWLIVLLNGAI